MVKPKEPWFGAGVVVALAGIALYGVTWQTDATTATPPSGTAFMYLLAGVLLLLGFASILLSAEVPRSAWRLVARRHRSPLPTATTEPEALDARAIQALHPLIIDGQLRLTLRYTDGTPLSLYGIEVQVTGPDGTFRLVRTGTDAHRDGIYRVQFPRDFQASRLSPGSYVIRWTQGLFDPGSNRFDAVGARTVAETCVQVTDNMKVRTAPHRSASP